MAFNACHSRVRLKQRVASAGLSCHTRGAVSHHGGYCCQQRASAVHRLLVIRTPSLKERPRTAVYRRTDEPARPATPNFLKV